MRTLDYDVVVIGAGPAGSQAARFAAKGGARTLLIEKRQEIGSPVRCGEGISKEWLPSVEIPYDKRYVAHEVDGAVIVSPAGYKVYIDALHAGNEVGCVLERDHFDKFIALLAARAGADIMIKTSATSLVKGDNGFTGVRAKVMGEPIEIRAKVIVAADGFESQVGRWAGIDTILPPKDVISTLQYRLGDIAIDPKYCEFHIGKKVSTGGYAWIFPKSDDVANVGLGVQLSKIKDPLEARRLLDKFIDSMPGLKKGEKLDMVAGAVSISAPLDRNVSQNVMIVGDAARVVDAITGGGISHACITGMYAGITAAEAIKANDNSEKFLQKYEERWRAKLESKLYRDWMAKEKLASLDDSVLDRIVKIISESKLGHLSVYSLLMAIKEKDPELVKEFEHLLM